MNENITDRKQIEDEPRESEVLFHTFADFTYDWEYWLNPNGDLIYVSPSCERISGYRPDEYLENPNLIQEIIHPNDRTIFIEHLHDKDHSTRSFSLEFRIRTRDNQDKWIEHNCQPIHDTDNNYLGERASNRDITYRRQIEEKLRKRTKRLRQEIKQRKKVSEELQSVYNHLSRVHEDERLAVSRELHDEIGQNLTALNIMLARATRSHGEKASSAVESAQSLVTEVLSQVHDLLQNVRQSIVERVGLLPGLISHFNRYEMLTGIKINFSHTGLETDFPDEVNDAAYHIIQEALTNVARHASVNRATVRMRVAKKKLKVLVQDKGIGFDPVAMSEVTTTGLSGMSERVKAIEGELKIDSSPGSGTRVSVELPLTIAQRRKRKES